MDESKLRQKRGLLNRKVKAFFEDDNATAKACESAEYTETNSNSEISFVDSPNQSEVDPMDVYQSDSNSDEMFSSSTDSDSDSDSGLSNDSTLNSNFNIELAQWATKSRCSRGSINDLLSILRKYGNNELPKDTRTLLKTPRLVQQENKCGGD